MCLAHQKSHFMKRAPISDVFVSVQTMPCDVSNHSAWSMDSLFSWFMGIKINLMSFAHQKCRFMKREPILDFFVSVWNMPCDISNHSVWSMDS
jgi:hypothetical protein